VLRPCPRANDRTSVPNWTEAEDAYVLAHFGQKPLYLIAKWLNRTSDAVRARYYQLRKTERGK
jgi:hypothetical protein